MKQIIVKIKEALTEEKKNDSYNYENKNKRKKHFLVFFSIALIAVLITYATIHLLVDNKHIMAYTDIFTIILLIGNLILLKFSKNIKLGINIGIFSYFIVTISCMIDGGLGNLAIIWVLIFPIFSFYWKGKFHGILTLLGFSSVYAGVIILKILGIMTTPYSYLTYSYVFLIFIVISMMAYFYEKATSESEGLIIKQLKTSALTNLANRIQLKEDVSKNEDFKLILINVDDFKAINNLYSDKIGDEVIIGISERLKEFINEKHIFNVYKLHADEFAVLAEDTTNKKDVQEIVKRIHQALSREFVIENLEIIVSVSIGVSIYKKNILSQADVALKLAKESRKDFLFYDKSMQIEENQKNNLKWIKTLKRAIAIDGVVPYFQPIINNHNGKIEKYECLIRLVDDDVIICPGSFLTVAQRSKIYPHLTKIMALKSIDKFKDQPYEFSINLSIDDIFNPDTMNFVFSLVKDYNVADRIIFEIMETEKIKDYQEILHFIRAVKEMGGKIAIDDFGTGYSNFDYILKMDIDFIKIDASLIKNLDANLHSKTITETVVNLAQRLKIKTIAEFVHSKRIFEEVKKIGIDYSQGYYLGKPSEELVKEI